MSSCTNCALYTKATNHVPGIYCNATESVDVMLIGEAPGANEDSAGLPFVGRAGQLLQNIMLDIGLTHNVYITNIIKHRPPNNRKPTLDEMVACGSLFLSKEIEILKPKAIVCLGRSSAEYLLTLNKSTFQGRLRGHKFIYNGHKVFCTWHPSYILRQPNRLPEIKHDLSEVLSYITN